MVRTLTRWLVLALICAAAGSRAQARVPAVFINELHYDNTGTDTGEFIEIAGPAGTDLSTYSIVLYNGSGGAVYDTDVLSGTLPNQENGFGTLSLAYPSNGIQNGSPDGVALVQGGTVIQFLSYEGAFTAVGGPANGQLSTDIGVTENGSGPVGQSLRLIGTGTTYSDFTWGGSAANSAGTVNPGQTFAGASGATIAIGDVTVAEGNTGTVEATFVVTVTGSHTGVSFDIATSNGTATTTDNDYVSRSAVGVSIPAGATTSTFTVVINGDLNIEPDERFTVTLSNVIAATVSDGQAIGTIANDDEPPAASSDVVISQVYGGGGNAGSTLTHDFIELFNRGTATVNLAGWSVQYGSATGTSWTVTPLSGSIGPGTYYLIGEAAPAGGGGTTPLPGPDASGTINLAGGAGKVALLTTTTAIVGACPPASVPDLVGYGATANCDEGAGPAPAPSNTLSALRKRGGCFDSNNNSIDLSTGAPNPRNSAAPARSCDFVPATIHGIQGSGLVTPLPGIDVTTTGIVTGRKANGFFLQTPDVDADPSTSEALFVFTGSTPAVAVGDAVIARGTAGEFFSLTQLESSLPGDIAVQSAGNPMPTATTLTPAMLDPTGPPDQLERFEGMRLHAAALISIAPTNGFGETFAVLPGVGRPMREPGVDVSLTLPPDPTNGVPDCCIPRFDENPERIVIDFDGLFGAVALSITSHVVLTNITGPLDFSFGDYKILPESTPGASANMSAVAVPAPAADEFTVAGFNIENFANDDIQRRKAALTIRQVLRYPDVIGHIEILSLAALQALAAQVNSDALAAGDPSPNYDALLVPASPGATQNVGFLVKASRVRADSVSQELASATYIDPVDNLAKTLHDRPPFVLHATAMLPGMTPRPVIVIVNHPRSFIDVELVGSEGARVRAKRTKQAESIAGLLQDLQTAHPTTPIIAVGDYNAYEFNDGFTDPLSIIRGVPTPDDQIVVDGSPDLVNPDFINLINLLPASERYSFVFEGNAQALDHVLVNSVAAGSVSRYAIGRSNADFPEGPLFAFDATRPERSSDHDIPVAYFRFSNVSGSVAVSRGGFRRNAATGRFQQAISVRNTSASALSGPVSLVLDGLSANATLFNGTGVTSCATPAGSAYVHVNVGPDGLLTPGESATIVLEFVNPTNAGITYATRVVAGAGCR